MLLLNLPNEVLDNIFSSLRQHNLLVLSLCSHNTHDWILPFLYRDIEFTIDLDVCPKGTWGNEDRIDSFIACLKCHPMRALWVTTASITWSEKRKYTRLKMFSILQLLPSLHTLKMKVDELKRHQFDVVINRGGSSSPSNASQLLCRLPCSRSLRNLTLDDPRTTIGDIARLLFIPALWQLTIVGFREEPHLSQFQDIYAPPAGSVRCLKFLNLWQPSEKSIGRLLKCQTQLRTLTCEIYSHYVISPLCLGNSFSLLQQNLVELCLTRPPDPTMILGRDGSQIDLSKFSSLKKLEILNDLLFPIVKWHERLTEQRDWTSFHILDLELSHRLPITLEFLRVCDPISSAKRK